MKTFNTYYENAEQIKNYVYENSLNDYRRGASSILIQVFSGKPIIAHINMVLSDIKKLMPEAHIVGITTAGEIVDGKVTYEKVVVSFSFFQKTQIKSLLIKNDFPELSTLVHHLTSILTTSQTKGILLYANHKAVNTEDLVNLIKTERPQINIFGGGAADNNQQSGQYVFSDTGLTDHGVLGVSFSGDEIAIHSSYFLNCTPVGAEHRVTDADDKTLKTLDDQPAAELYSSYRIDDQYEAEPVAIVFDKDGLPVTRSIRSVEEDGTINLSKRIKTGQTIRFALANDDNQEHALAAVDQLRKHQPESVFVFTCTNRSRQKSGQAENELNVVKELGTICGFYANGEFLSTEHSNVVMSRSTIVVALSEQESEKAREAEDKPETAQASSAPLTE